MPSYVSFPLFSFDPDRPWGLSGSKLYKLIVSSFSLRFAQVVKVCLADQDDQLLEE